MTAPVIRVSAAVIVDDAGRLLVVRKRGTDRFMNPGGKPEQGESAAETLVRELAEELGVTVAPGDLRPLGCYTTDAANEAGHVLVADCFALRLGPAATEARAEIAELRWITEAEASALPLAPLIEVLRPHIWG
ncbi:NUDIX domain-containing protein [uncultured Microbacterium sp.]|uniref:NUDIX hydrolase n=1 Tax=uncultured Microbacterium sp. TaxID=191216 RepID=UPI0035CC22B0